MRRTRRIAALAAAGLFLSGGGLLALDALDRAYPPPLDRADLVSTEVRDHDGALLRAFSTGDGRWRLKTTAADVDPQFLRMLVAYEDRRFERHNGIDVRALARAAVQFATHGRIVSGASTLSMQVARLLEPREDRSLLAKLRQMLRAVQIERRLDKAAILDLYLTLAPYGGNLEGVRAASLAWFGKEPKRLSVAEAALLVALPQLPERRRPDRHPDAAERAKERVLKRLAVIEAIGGEEAGRAALMPVPRTRHPLPGLAPHVAERARRSDPGARVLTTALDRSMQAALEDVAASAAPRLGPRVSVALMMADIRTGRILASVGSPSHLDMARFGAIDMTGALRSPGSTLKPFIYGLAFEQGFVAQETLIEDRPSDFYGYRPRNFDMGYQGDVSIRTALQMSLNVPAIRLLDKVGPARLMARFRKAGVSMKLPPGEEPGLSIGLGGVGITLADLVTLYAALANRGRIVDLGTALAPGKGRLDGEVLIEPIATWNVTDILSDVLPPAGARARGIAYKTGTSYGYRDAWSIGYDGRHVIGVWVGRADNAAVPGISGYQTAAPILFEAFEKAGIAATPQAPAPPGADRLPATELPASQRRFSLSADGLLVSARREQPPRIVFPPQGARVALDRPEGGLSPLVLKLQGGTAPFRWIANGRPLEGLERRRTSEWAPDGPGASTLTVIDAAGRAASVDVFIE